MKRIGKRFLVLALATALMVSVCGCGEDKPTGGSTGDGSTAQGGSATQGSSAAQGSGAGGDGQGSSTAQGSGTGGGAAQDGNGAGGESGGVIADGNEKFDLQVVIYSKTKADFIISSVSADSDSFGSCGVTFGLSGGSYEVHVDGSDMQGTLWAWNGEEKSFIGVCDCSGGGDSLTLSVDMAEVNAGFDFYSVSEYKLVDYFTIADVQTGEFYRKIFAAADVVRDESAGYDDTPYAAAEEFEYEDDGNGGVIITGIKRSYWEEDIYVPREIDGKPVTGFGKQVSAGVPNRIIIPDSVTAIGDYAFAYSEFSAVIIPESVKTIGDYAFFRSGLESVTVSGQGVVIGRYAFNECDNLKSVTILNEAVVGEYAFYECKSLASVEVSAESIGDSAFAGCVSLASVVLSGSVKSMGREAFAGEWDYNDRRFMLTDVVIREGVEQIGEQAFAFNGMTSLTIPSSVKTIGRDAFLQCEKLSSVTLSEGLEELGMGAFQECGLTEITIPGSLTEIGENAFASNQNLTSLTVPGTVKKIGFGAFSGCDSLTNVVVEEGVEVIDDLAFAGYDCPLNISLPDSLKEICDRHTLDVFYKSFQVTVTYKGKTYDYSTRQSLYSAVNGQ